MSTNRTFLSFAVIVFSTACVAAQAANLVNVSARGQVGTDQQRMIVGFILNGAGKKQIGLFALGPSLSAGGVEGVLEDPRLILLKTDSGEVVTANDNWRDNQDATLVETWLSSIGVTPADSEAATIIELEAGSYSLLVQGANGGTGIAGGGAVDVVIESLITAGTWTSSDSSLCFNVSLDGSKLTATGSACPSGASLFADDIGFCSLSIATQNDIPITDNSFAHTLIAANDQTTITGDFSTTATASGSAERVIGTSSCDATWSAEPVQ